MKRINTLVIILTCVIAAISFTEISAKPSSALSRAKNLKEMTGKAVETIASDSLGESVVMELPDDEMDEDSCGDYRAERIDAAKCEIRDEHSLWEWVIPIVAIVFGMGVPGAVIVVCVYFMQRGRTRRIKLRYDAIARCAEAGHPLPSEFFAQEQPNETMLLRSGLIWIGWALAVFLLGAVMNFKALAALSPIPLAVGVARIISYIIRRKTSRELNGDTRSQL